MAGHDIVVIGASAGGVDALITVASALPADIPAALFAVLHIAAAGPTLLPEILSATSPLPAHQPSDGDSIARGHIYVAPPDHHLLIGRGHIHLAHGPKENGFRPAIDATFRSAARAYGPRVVGVILTGMLDDGTAGLLAVKRRGGIAVVQEPAEALFPSMPASAIRYVGADTIVSLNEIAPLLARLASQPVETGGEVPISDDLELEVNISEMDREALQDADQFGALAPFSCPGCGGVLAEFYDGDLLRFRCQVGHAYSHESLLARQADTLDHSLWAAYRALDERTTLAQRLARDARKLNDQTGERRFTQLIEQAERRKEQIRQALLKDEVT